MAALFNIKYRKALQENVPQWKPSAPKARTLTTVFCPTACLTYLTSFAIGFIGFQQYLAFEGGDTQPIPAKQTLVFEDTLANDPQEIIAGKAFVASNAVTEPAAPIKLRQMIVSVDRLPVFSKMDAQGTVQMTLRYGQFFLASTIDKNWVQLQEGGFVRAEYLTKAFMVNLESDYLRVRTIPSLKGQVVSSLDNGAVIHAKILDNGWAKIGPGEYVHASFLEAYYTNHFGS